MKKYIRMGITALISIALIVGFYYYMTHRQTKSAEDDVEITQLDQVLTKRLDTAYPPTPREVIKFYNRIIECAYGDEYTAEQFDQLASQARMLMDQELLDNNPQDTYKSQLEKEISSYKEDSRKILQTKVCNTDDVYFREIAGKKCAYVQATYFMKTGKSDFQRPIKATCCARTKTNTGKSWPII